MAGHQFRVGIVGASSLLGKELSEELGKSPLATAELVLLDATDAEGQLASAGEELAVIHAIDEEALERLDFVFFAGTREQTRAHWATARGNGATVIDLTRALTDEPGAILWSPWLQTGTTAKDGSAAEAMVPDLNTTIVVPAYGASMMLALVGERLRAAGLAVRTFAATLLLPASEHGRAGMDELHQQTVGLLSFKPTPEEVFGTQVAFNVVSAFGREAKVSLGDERVSVMEQYERLSRGQLPELALQVVQVPVFHGYTISLFVELASATTMSALEQAMQGARLKLVNGEREAAKHGEDESAGRDEMPSNLTAAGQDDVLLRMTADQTGERISRVWFWMAADNLRLTTTAAIVCALEMRRLRPHGKVQ